MAQNKINLSSLIEGIKIINQNLKSYKNYFMFLGFLGTIGSIANALTPILVGKFLDGLIIIYNTKILNFNFIFLILIFWLILKIINDLVDWYLSINLERAGTLIEAKYIASGFKHLTELPLYFHKEKKHGEITRKIEMAAGWMSNIVINIYLNIIIEFLTLVLALILTSLINFKLTLILIFALLIYTFILLKTAPQLAFLQRRVHKFYSRAYGDAYDKLQNISEIKQYSMEEFEQKEIYKKFVHWAAKTWLKMNKIMQNLNFSQKILTTTTQLILFFVSIFFIKNGEITIGQLAAFNAYAAMVFGPFIVLGRNWQNIQNGIVAIIESQKVLNIPKEIYVPPNAITLEKIKGKIEFQNVSFAYKHSKKIILNNISFKIEPGQKVALIGRSGAGKTTIIDLIFGFYFAQSGKVLIDDINIKKLNLKKYRQHLAVVPQEPTLFNETIKYNIAYGSLNSSLKDIKKAAELANASEFIEKLPRGYNQIVGWRGIKLSIGQKQRIALARAFLKNPDILILDEPTSALDAESEMLIKESLKRLMQGRTTIIIAHRFSTIKDCDKILVLENGQIIESGSHNELMQNPKSTYFKLYSLQVKDFIPE